MKLEQDGSITFDLAELPQVLSVTSACMLANEAELRRADEVIGDLQGQVTTAGELAVKHETEIAHWKEQHADMRRVAEEKATEGQNLWNHLRDAPSPMEIACCAHRVTVRWWSITGTVGNGQLEADAEEHVRECLAKDYSSGQLNHEDDESSATGYWEIIR